MRDQCLAEHSKRVGYSGATGHGIVHVPTQRDNGDRTFLKHEPATPPMPTGPDNALPCSKTACATSVPIFAYHTSTRDASPYTPVLAIGSLRYSSTGHRRGNSAPPSRSTSTGPPRYRLLSESRDISLLSPSARAPSAPKSTPFSLLSQTTLGLYVDM
eukprot:3984-Rhodomonas_salina.3